MKVGNSNIRLSSKGKKEISFQSQKTSDADANPPGESLALIISNIMGRIVRLNDINGAWILGADMVYA